MTAKAESMAPPKGRHPKRRMRNYLLDPKFQLKYTGMVVGVTVVVAAVLGYFAFEYSKGQTQMLTINKMESELESGRDVSEDFVQDLQRYAEQEDLRVGLGIMGGILFMTLSLAMTGILVTHRLVGPAFRIRRLLGDVRDGKLRVVGRLRKGDELQAVFEAFEEMVVSLRNRREREIAVLDEVLGALDGETAEKVQALRNEIQETLD